MGLDITRTYRPSAREWETDMGPVRRRKKAAKTPFDRKDSDLGCTKKKMKKAKVTKPKVTVAQLECIMNSDTPRLEPVNNLTFR